MSVRGAHFGPSQTLSRRDRSIARASVTVTATKKKTPT